MRLSVLPYCGQAVRLGGEHRAADKLGRRSAIGAVFHDLRHTGATLLLRDGARIREVLDQLGRACVTTTVLDDTKRTITRLADENE